MRYFSRDQAPTAHVRARLDALGIPVTKGAVARLEVSDDQLTGVQMVDGRVVPLEVVAVATRMVAHAEVFVGLGIAPTAPPTGSFIAVDATGRTVVPGVWAAGNVSDLSAQVSAAAADGARAAQHVNADLVISDADRAVAGLAAAGNHR